MKASLLALGSLGFLGLACIGAGYFWLMSAFDASGPMRTNADPVVIAPGSGVAAIARDLADAGVLVHPRVFELGVRLEGQAGALRAGEYAFPPGASPRQIMARMVAGQVVIHALTFPEGLTTQTILSLLEDTPILSGDLTVRPPEGTLLPETYHVHRGDSRDTLVMRMGRAQREAMARLWPHRAADLPFETPAQAIVLASIVERETGIKGERPRVAGVFVNRLRRGMPLQSDPTVIYGLSEGGSGRLDRALTSGDLRTDHAWNTYTRSGLPPSPICNPGLASLQAVLNPLETNELYFVADGTGGHTFAETLDEHNRNVREWRRIQRERSPVLP